MSGKRLINKPKSIVVTFGRKDKPTKKDLTKFSKKIVVFCIAFVVLYTVIQVLLSYKLNLELSPTLTTCVYAFFGTELAASALIRIFDKDNTSENNSKDNNSLG